MPPKTDNQIVAAIANGQTKPDPESAAPLPTLTPASEETADALNEQELAGSASSQATDVSTGTKPFYIGLDFDQHLSPVWNRVQWADFFLLYSKTLSADDISLCNEAAKSLGVIFEIGTADMAGDGADQAALFLEQMTALGVRPKPQSAVLVAADIDMTAPSQVVQAIKHLTDFATAVGNEGWSLGSYGDGALELALSRQESPLNIVGWSAGAKGWYQTRIYDGSGLWKINQGPTLTHGGVWPQPGTLRLGSGGSSYVQPQSWPNIGVAYDPNVATTLDWAI